VFGEDFIHDAVGFGLFGVHVEVAVGIGGDPFEGLAGVLGQDFVQGLPGFEDFLSETCPPTCP
jgi:hypothetical protein